MWGGWRDAEEEVAGAEGEVAGAEGRLAEAVSSSLDSSAQEASASAAECTILGAWARAWTLLTRRPCQDLWPPGSPGLPPPQPQV